MFRLEHNGDDVEYAMIVVDENNSTINDMDSPSMKVSIISISYSTICDIKLKCFNIACTK